MAEPGNVHSELGLFGGVRTRAEAGRTMEGRCGAGGGVPCNVDGILDCQGQAA